MARKQASGTYPEIIVRVNDIAHGGLSVGRADDGRVVFVRGAIPGEKVRAAVTDMKKRFLKARVLEVLEASSHRVEPRWPAGAAGVTGAADFQHIDLLWQRELKARVIRTQIERVGGAELAEQIPAEAVQPRAVDTEDCSDGWHTRTRFDAIKMRTGVGMYREHTHELVALSEMPLAVRELESLGIFGSAWDSVIAPGERMHIVAPASGPNLIVLPQRELIFTSDSIGHDGDAAEQDLPIRRRSRAYDSNMELGADAISMLFEQKGEEYVLHERASDGECIYEYDVAPDGFWQVHRSAPSAVLRTVMQCAQVQPGQRVLELFSGAGLLSVPLARAVGSSGQLLSIEGSDQAVRCAAMNLHGCPWAQARQGWINARTVQAAMQQLQPNLVVADPPRAGLGVQSARVLAEAPSVQRVVLVSCDPAAMARDAGALVSEGFAVTNFSVLDLFPHTHHVETVCLLTRQNVKEHLYVDVDMKDLKREKLPPKPTCKQIQAYVLEKYGLKVSPLYIATLKDELGLEKQFSYKKEGMAAKNRPQCPKDKHDAIIEAFKHFKMIS